MENPKMESPTSYPQVRPMNILVAVDGSEHATAGVSLLRDLPLPADSRIKVLAVFRPRDASNVTSHEQNVARAMEELRWKDLQVETDVLAGYPAEVLTQYAEEHKPDLIVLGARGLRATLGILLGGVAQQVVEYSNRPVLVVRAPYSGLKRVLLVTDGSPCSEQAVQYLGRFPLQEETEINVMLVMLPPPLPQSVLLAQSWPSYDRSGALQLQDEAEIKAMLDEEERQGRELVDKAVAQLRGLISDHSQKITIQGVLRRGDAATEIIEFARENQIDLIVAGSRGLSQMRSWLLGSVSRKLVHYADCSVLVVRGIPGCTQA